MKQTAIQQAIVMVRNRMESMNDTLMGKHTAHHLQQVERDLYDLLEKEKEQIMKSHIDAFDNIVVDFKKQEFAEQYYNETYK
jgi:uncharacterized protein (DUF2164 family)